MARIVVVFTGGTISMRATSDTRGNEPALDGRKLLRTIPGIDQLADVELIDWGLVPGSHLGFEDVLSIGRLVHENLTRPEVDGVVIVQGTDTIEETAFAWDLLPMPQKPVVVAGAMRSASQDGYDGPDNLRNAITVAADRMLADQGVVVAMAGEIHGADAVRKTHTHAYETFKSPGAGPLGSVADGRVHLSRKRRPFHLPSAPERGARVLGITAVLGWDPAAMEIARSQALEAVVVEAMGGGNTHPHVLDLAAALMSKGVPVVLTTRCPSGQVRPGYGFPGGSTRWWEAGAIFSGDLGGLKSRVALALAIGARLDRPALGELFSQFGGGAKA
ncbi:MAG: asparaginase [Candidatus Limnocylindria bacterium]